MCESFSKNQYCFSENRQIVYTERHSILLNLSLGDAFLAILKARISKISFRVGPNHGGSSYITKGRIIKIKAPKSGHA